MSTLRGRLVLVVLASVLPLLGFILVQIQLGYRAERESAGRRALDVARSMAQRVDRELQTQIVALQVLALSRALKSGDLDVFRDQAAEFLTLNAPQASIGVTDETGRFLLVVGAAASGRSPDRRGNPGVAAEVFGQRRPVVSNLYVGRTTGRLGYTVDVPVIQDDRVLFALTLNPYLGRLQEIIDLQRPEPGRVVTIFDAAGMIAARSPSPQLFVGKPSSPVFLEAIRASQEGVFETQSLEGVPVLVAYSLSGSTGWGVGIGIPIAEIAAPSWRNASLALVIGAILLVTGLELARRVARGITKPIESLVRLSASGPDAPAPTTGLREVDEVGAVLRGLRGELEARVDERTRELAAANESLRAEIRAREEAEGRVRQIQKMEAVGQLTGGIAHDFNNMLAVIGGSVELAKKRLSRGTGDVGRLLDAAADATARAAALTSRLLAFSRQQPLSPERVDVNRLIDGMTELLRRTLGAAVRLDTKLAPDLGPTRIDPGQLENALLNLAINSRDAMSEGGGTLLIRTARSRLDESAARSAGVAAGDYLSVFVSDTGRGMSGEVAARAFEPFFTTKPVGKGTGLGLSQVYGFVRQSGGHVRIRSEPGQGTTVELLLPQLSTDQAGDSGPVGACGRAESAAEVGFTERGPVTVLVVEDEARVRRHTVAALEEIGYVPLEADDGLHALRLLEARPDIRVLLTDVLMPGMDGRRLASEARRLRPDLKVLFTSGFPGSTGSHEGALGLEGELVRKPFSLDELASRLREALTPSSEAICPPPPEPAKAASEDVAQERA